MQKDINDCKNILNDFIGLSIKKCLRHFTSGLNEEIPIIDREQESDGEICLILSNGLTAFFYAFTEEFTIKMELDSTLRDEFVDISKNNFWGSKIDIEIEDVVLLYGKYRTNPYGLEFRLKNGEKFEIVYIDENEYDNDLIVVQ